MRLDLLAATIEQAVSEVQRDGSCILSVPTADIGNGDGMLVEIFLSLSLLQQTGLISFLWSETILRLLQLRYDFSIALRVYDFWSLACLITGWVSPWRRLFHSNLALLEANWCSVSSDDTQGEMLVQEPVSD